MLADVSGGDVAQATDALLSLTYHEPDRLWMEATLLDLVDNAPDPQVRALAVVCLGHLARIHRSITAAKIVPKLQELESDPNLSSRAVNALEDFAIFAGE